VDATNVNELKNAVERVLNDSDLQANMIKNGYEYAQRFTPEYIGESFMSIYNECLNI